MIRHTVAWKFREGVDAQTEYSVLEELSRFPEEFPAMRGWTIGPNLSDRDDTYTHAFTVDFDTEDELQAYLRSEQHEMYVATRWREVVAARAIVTLEILG
ncbi:Dabb family protein [Rhodococcus rhodochrous]|uniref:Dabb family protein n=1 Tax=Rhodococcus rhodochrous TaxID=1829 RepID=A0AAW4XNM9_RHORH|nr:Dabb family protein [Rhodococcus rhodochrous]MCD2114588.1 Dabb family protein [Rhodococcus rhodochrous]